MINELVAGYREIDADLFWIWVWNFEPSGRQYERVRSLARRLQNQSATPCLLGGIGRLYEAALRLEPGRARAEFAEIVAAADELRGRLELSAGRRRAKTSASNPSVCMSYRHTERCHR